MAFLEVVNYKKSFGNTRVLKGVSFGLEKGQVLAIIGSSGGGKTTLLRCINFLETPDSGKLYLNGELLFDADEEKNRRMRDEEIRRKRLHFGLVFQQFNLFPQYSVLGNVTLARRLLDREFVANKKRELAAGGLHGRRLKEEINLLSAETEQRTNADALALIERVGLSDKLNAYPCELSGGQCHSTSRRAHSTPN